MMQSLKKLEWLIRTETSRRKELMDKMRMESVDMTEKNIDRIAALFPNCITEALDEERSTPDHKVYKKVVNFDMLRQMLSGDVLEGDEAYEFTWVGKKAAIVEANKPVRKTLRPCPKRVLIGILRRICISRVTILMY
jgi:adenine-specific DNA-methyltransferase